MLEAELLEGIVSRLNSPCLVVGISFIDAFNGFPKVLPLPFEICGQRFVDGLGGVNTAPLHILVQLSLPFWCEMHFHSSNVRFSLSCVNSETNIPKVLRGLFRREPPPWPALPVAHIQCISRRLLLDRAT